MQFSKWIPLSGALVLAATGIFVGLRWLNEEPDGMPSAPEAGSTFETGARGNDPGLPSSSAKTLDQQAAERALRKEALINRFAQCFRISTPDEHRLECLHLLKEITADDVPAVLDLFIRESKQGVVPDADWHALWRRWGALDGPAALDYHLKLPDSSWNGLDLWRTMLGWSQSNPQEAAAWLQSHPEARHFDNVFLGYVEGYASTDLRAATEMTVNSIASGDPMLWRATEQLAEQALRQGKLAGLESWFDQLPADTRPGSAKHAAEDHVWWRLQSANFDTGVAWVRKHADGPWRSDHIIGEVANRLSGQNPMTAIEWLDSVRASPKDGSFPGLDKVVAKWAQKDATALESWLGQPDGGALRQQALAHYTNFRAALDPAAARGSPPRTPSR